MMQPGIASDTQPTSPGTAPPWLRQQPNQGGFSSRMMFSDSPGAGVPPPGSGTGAATPMQGMDTSTSASGAGGASLPSGSYSTLPGVNVGSQRAFAGGPSVTTANIDLSNPNLTPIKNDFSGDAQRAGDAFYKGATQYFEPDFTRDTSALQTQLINQGFAPGSEGYNTQLDLLRRNQDQARTGAAAGAVAAGNQQAQNEFLQALQARQEQFGEAGNVADRAYNQSLGIAGLGLGARGQDVGLQGSMAGLAASRENAGASRYNADLQHQIQLQQLGLQANGQNFDQVMSLMGGARGGVNMSNFGNPQPLDVTGAGSLANQSTMLGNQATAARNAGLYGLGAAALSGLGSYFGGP